MSSFAISSPDEFLISESVISDINNGFIYKMHKVAINWNQLTCRLTSFIFYSDVYQLQYTVIYLKL